MSAALPGAGVQQLVTFPVQIGGIKLRFGLSVRYVAGGAPRLPRRIEMASKAFKGVVGACIAGSMLFSSTAAMASVPARAQQVSPWAALSVLSGGAPAAAICGSTAAAAVAAA